MPRAGRHVPRQLETQQRMNYLEHFLVVNGIICSLVIAYILIKKK